MARTMTAAVLLLVLVCAVALDATGERHEASAAPNDPVKFGMLVRITKHETLAPKFYALARAEAKCPKGYGIVAGGASMNLVGEPSGTVGQPHHPHLGQSYPDLEAQSWVVAAAQPPLVIGMDGPMTADVFAVAYCSLSGRAVVPDRAGRSPAVAPTPNSVGAQTTTLKLVEKRALIPGGFFKYASAVATCPAGYGLVSGGARVLGTIFARLAQSFPDQEKANSWRATVLQPPFLAGTTAPTRGSITSFALCSKKGRPVVPMPNGSPSQGVLDGPSLSADAAGIRPRPRPASMIFGRADIPGEFNAGGESLAKCADERIVVAGGAADKTSAYPHLIQNVPDLAANGWRAHAVQPTVTTGAVKPDAGELLTFAICARRGVPMLPLSQVGLPAGSRATRPDPAR